MKDIKRRNERRKQIMKIKNKSLVENNKMKGEGKARRMARRKVYC